jgi:type I restriction enzyme S subunit
VSRFLPQGSILVTCIASIGKNAIARVPLATNQQINSIVINKKNNNEFIYYIIQNSKNLLKRFAGAGAMPILNKITFSKIKILIPKLEEQNAIAEILTIADKEIEVLEKKFSILRNQKKYLLNNLITGKIRIKE